jgi:hypothetical protein
MNGDPGAVGPLASGAGVPQDRVMSSVQATAYATAASRRGRCAHGLNNNNRNNASLPRAGD